MFDSENETSATLSFRQFATEEHRRFHDRIVADLNGILPVCNQGKCTAASISDSPTEQQQITDLMHKVEQLCTHLSENVTDLFSQYYDERSRFCGAAYCTTAEIKLRLVDRALQDRATDVRWWSKEPILANAVGTLGKIRRAMKKDIAEMNAYLEGAIAQFRIPSQSNDWRSIDIEDRVKEVSNYLSFEEELLFDAKLRSELVSALETLIEFLSKGENQSGTIKFAQKLVNKFRTCEARIEDACQQLATIQATYPSIYDIVVTDNSGTIIANARSSVRSDVVSQSVADESWYQAALTSAIKSTYIERVSAGPEKIPAIVFASGIAEQGADRQSSPLGTIGVFCDFQSEVRDLLDNYLPLSENGQTRDGWYSFFTDGRGIVVCANDPDAIPPGLHCEIPRAHRQLSKGETKWSNLVFKGRDSFIFSACSSDQRAAGSSGWISHVVAPSGDIMQATKKDSSKLIEEGDLLHSKLVPDISKSTYASLQEDRKAIKLISLNGILFASQLGKRGAALAPVFDKITATGDSATSRMELLLEEMAGSEIRLNLRLQEVLAKQAVDLMFQKIYERSQAMRLWVRTSSFRELLRAGGEEIEKEAGDLIRLINDDYPAYRNIFVVDMSGDLRCCARPQQFRDPKGLCVADQSWFAAAARPHNCDVPQIMESDSKFLDSGKSTVVFALGIPDGDRDDTLLGVLGCLFDWQSEAVHVVNACLPKTPEGRNVPGSMALFSNQDQVILESTNHSLLTPGEFFRMPEDHLYLNPGQTKCSPFTFQQDVYILASARCDDHTDRRGIDWTSHVLRPLN